MLPPLLASKPPLAHRSHTNMEHNTAYSIPSDNDNDPSASTKPKRGSRACDRCRKIKSKCEPSDGDSCKNCIAAGSTCTFQGPSFKRGPPKGYIHAIEQRWHQVECILGTIMASPRSREIMDDLREDPLARYVLGRVEIGPYGPNSQFRQGPNTSVEGLYDAIMGHSELGTSSDDRRSRRQSRVSREMVSTQDHTPTIPTAEWQESMARRLSRSSATSLRASTSPSEGCTYLATPSSIAVSSGEPRKRRMRQDVTGPNIPDSSRVVPHHMYTLEDPYPEDLNETVHALGQLSVNENQEIRYHGKAAGLHLLAKSARNDDSQTKENGIWKFHGPITHPPDELSEYSMGLRDDQALLPPLQVQEHLIRVYFAFVHPSFPVIQKQQFLQAFEQFRNSSVDGFVVDVPDTPPQGKSHQGISKLLLLAMFAYAARYSGADAQSPAHTDARPEGGVSKAGNIYATRARTVLNRIYQNSRPSTCQALLLLGIREFGIGSMEQAWIYTGMAARMAIDLGMNRDADNWKDAQGKHLFTGADRQARRRLWWSCCTVDKLSAVWLGRPVVFRDGDFDTPCPDLEEVTSHASMGSIGRNLSNTSGTQDEEYDLWRPYPEDTFGPDFVPEPGRIISCFREQCKLSFLMSQIMTKIYPVKSAIGDAPKREELEKLETSLHQWYFNLPEHLTYSDMSRRVAPLPHILLLHMEYQFAVLLLHRAFLPNWNDRNSGATQESDPLPMKSFDICQGAAAHISSMVTTFNNKYGMEYCPPLMSIYVQSAGIMHVVTLNGRPGNTQATVGLLQCIEAARAMEYTWPCAIRVRSLLNGAQVQLDDLSALSHSPDRRKRPLDEALGSDRNSDTLHPDAFGMPITTTSHHPGRYLEDDGSRMMAHVMGVPLPGIQPSPSYYPGYEWWPYNMPTIPEYGMSGEANYGGPEGPGGIHTNAPFTFDEGQYSSAFVQGVNSPNPDMYHYPPESHG